MTTPTAPRRLVLPDAAARELREAGRAEAWTAFKDQPKPSELYGYCEAFHADSEYSREPGATFHGVPVTPHRWWYADASGPREAFDCPRPRPGDAVWIAEAWRAKSWSAEGGWGEIGYVDGTVRQVEGDWSFTRMYPFDLPPKVWRSGRIMPMFASRTAARVVAVRVERRVGAWGWVREVEREG